MAFDHSTNFLSNGRDPRHLASRTDLEDLIEDRGKDEIVKRQAAFADLQKWHRKMMDEMIAQKQTMFGRTPPEVSLNALTLAIEEAHQKAQLLAAEGMAQGKIADIRLFRAEIRGSEVAFKTEGQKTPSFVDDGKNIYVPGYQDDVALLASLQLAQMRWGYIKVTGQPDFQERVVQLAAEFDLKLSNEDLAARVQQRRASPGVLSAPSEGERKAAAQLHAEAPVGDAQAAGVKAPVAEAAAPEMVSRQIEPQPPETHDDDVIETAHAAQRDVAAPRPVQPETPVDAPPVANEVTQAQPGDKAWIAALQEERLAKKAAQGQQPRSGSGEGDSTSVIVDEEPDQEIDLGYEDDEEFSVDAPSLPQATPEPKKSATIAARP